MVYHIDNLPLFLGLIMRIQIESKSMLVHTFKKDMKFMYIPGQKHHYGRVQGMLPFYAYLHHMFRKTLAPREGDQPNISFYGRDLLKYMNPSERDFCVVDYIWEEMKTISCSPQKSCGYAPYVMHIIEAITNSTFE